MMAPHFRLSCAALSPLPRLACACSRPKTGRVACHENRHPLPGLVRRTRGQAGTCLILYSPYYTKAPSVRALHGQSEAQPWRSSRTHRTRVPSLSLSPSLCSTSALSLLSLSPQVPLCAHAYAIAPSLTLFALLQPLPLFLR